MTQHDQIAMIEKLGDTDLTVSDPREDIRGRDVVDKSGEKIGTVDALFIDQQDNKVRFMQVASGGFLGIGEDHAMIPVDAITSISEDEVRIDRAKEQVSGGPAYDPALAQKTEYWNTVYGHYGYAPYWSTGYVYPGYPYYYP